MKWEEYLHLVEFDYNNGYCESLGMRPFEVLQGRKWRVPTNWNNPKNKLVLGLKILAEMENIVKKVHQNLKASQDRKKIYTDEKRTYRESKWETTYIYKLSLKEAHSGGAIH